MTNKDNRGDITITPDTTGSPQAHPHLQTIQSKVPAS